jgi:3'(2'), 5'-bisphosphate nucleotidase
MLASQVDELCRIAQDAGQQIMAVYAHADVQASQKADQSPLTEADLRAHDVIDAGLRSAFPGVPVWSEEGAQPASAASEFFLVDPLDGTKEFLARNGEFTVNIAFVKDGKPVAGVVFAPALGQLYFASEGLGAFRRDPTSGVPLRTRAPAAGQPLRVIGSRSHGGADLAAWVQRLAVPHTFVPAGSSLKFCRLAEGVADVYPRHGPTCQWDTAAGQAVLECAGGAVLDPQGHALQYGVDRAVLNPFFIALATPGLQVPSLT